MSASTENSNPRPTVAEANATPASHDPAEAVAPAGGPVPTEGVAESQQAGAAAAQTPTDTPVTPARVPWLEVGVFILVAGGLGWLVCLPLWLSGKGLADPVLTQICATTLMFTPLLGTVAAVLVQRRRHRATIPNIPRYLGLWPLYPVGRVLGVTGLAVLGTYLLVLAAAFVSAAFGWLSLDLGGLSGFRSALTGLPGLDTMPLGAALAVYLLIVVVNTAATAVFAFGEEVGWRGWLLTSLRPLGTWPLLVIIGVVWGLWHAPLILLGYNFARPNLAGLALMVGACIALSILFGWLRLRTGSVWPAVFAHAALNASAGMLLALVLNGNAPAPDAALVTMLGVSGWIVSGVVILVLILTGQFRRQPSHGGAALEA
ncbi:CPBP family intramembrane metalloprotease [Brevibacterium ammoniilyticum]|uniref:CPBP family intramembrane metalloprotease n=1 Tax=Brevibacterium ammoniilyticum TaxID=1046555 RepID=A0ABP9UBB3_9MICO